MQTNFGDRDKAHTCLDQRVSTFRHGQGLCSQLDPQEPLILTINVIEMTHHHHRHPSINSLYLFGPLF